MLEIFSILLLSRRSGCLFLLLGRLVLRMLRDEDDYLLSAVGMRGVSTETRCSLCPKELPVCQAAKLGLMMNDFLNK